MSVAVAITGQISNGVGANVGDGQGDTTLREIIVDGTLTLSGSYVAGGDAINFTTPAPAFSFGNQAPTRVEIFEKPVKGTAGTGFVFVYAYGPSLAAPTQAGGALQIFGGAASPGQGLTELSAGPYSGSTPSLSGAVLGFRAWVVRL